MEKLVTIKTLSELKKLQEYLNDKDYFSIDTETTGVERESTVIGLSICAEDNLAYYVVLYYWDVTEQKLLALETTREIKALLQSLAGKSLIMQNAPFDCAMIKNNFGIELMPYVHTDTLPLGHLLNENRHNGLKERGVELYGEDARQEQQEMKESVHKNGGLLTKDAYELYKADADLLAKYGAKDALLTFKIMDHDIYELNQQGLESFFYDDETMPLLRGPTYDLNTTGLRVDPEKLQTLKSTLEAECLELKAFIYKEIDASVKTKYPGPSKAKTFNIGASQQLSWLLFFQLGNEFNTLTDCGKEVCEALGMRPPYTASAKKEFIRVIQENKDRIYCPAVWNPKTKKMGNPKKVGDPWKYTSCGKESLGKYSKKYKWVAKFLDYAKNMKILNTYIEGIQSKMKYNIIRPSFLQHGTTSGRYSSRHPNFQNLPRDDKRIKACIISRPGKVFVGADYAQLEPRVFASFAKDERLLKGFADGDDFYSVIGQPIFDAYDCILKKDETPNSFAVKYKKYRDAAKVVALATPYGTTAFQMSRTLGKSPDECQEIINKYFESYPGVKALMLSSHEEAKQNGVVYNLFGRPRRMPKAMDIPKIYGKNTKHSDLPYEARNILNLAMNHKIQSTGASIMNRAAIAFHRRCRAMETEDASWAEVKLVMQVHDELIAEAPEHLAEQVVALMKDAMENTVQLPGVALIAEPKIACNLADLK